MKRFFLTCAVATICFGLCSLAPANPTLTLTGSSQSESPGATTVKDDSDDSSFFLKEWLYWLLDDIFGWDRRGGKKSYYQGTSSLEPDSGDGSGDSDFDSGGWDFDSGGDWDYDSGDEGSGDDPGNDDWGFDPGNDGCDGDTDGGGWDGGVPGSSEPQTIPAPGALVLGGIGSALVTWLRRRKAL